MLYDNAGTKAGVSASSVQQPIPLQIHTEAFVRVSLKRGVVAATVAILLGGAAASAFAEPAARLDSSSGICGDLGCSSGDTKCADGVYTPDPGGTMHIKFTCYMAGTAY